MRRRTYAFCRGLLLHPTGYIDPEARLERGPQDDSSSVVQTILLNPRSAHGSNGFEQQAGHIIMLRRVSHKHIEFRHQPLEHLWRL